MKKGFTLIELITYVSVLSIIVLALFSFFLWISRSNTKAKAIRETVVNSKKAIEIISREIKESEGVYTPTTSSTQLSLETKNYLGEGEKTSYIDFFLCQNQLCLKKEGEDPVALTSEAVEIKKLGFFQIATTSSFPSIQIVLEVEYSNPLGKPEHRASFSATSTVSLRNY